MDQIWDNALGAIRCQMFDTMTGNNHYSLIIG